ncbi:MAG TPA: protein-L-isoaspartate O-methyltransferase, partial [Spirochaetota bacterium]|nr:protein-L-isoaspartate O-methyltransferase [Spirochaetota bacterium]
RIILTASPPVIPQTLIDQLADGGILVSPEGEFMQELVRIRKNGDRITKESITYVRFVPMVHGR